VDAAAANMGSPDYQSSVHSGHMGRHCARENSNGNDSRMLGLDLMQWTGRYLNFLARGDSYREKRPAESSKLGESACNSAEYLTLSRASSCLTLADCR